MKTAKFLVLMFIVSCSTGKVSKDNKAANASSEVSQDSFKKDKILTSTEVKDYYIDRQKTFNPALQDETIDRNSNEEISSLADSKDPLIDIAVKCSKKEFDKAFSVADVIFNRYQKIPAYWNLIANCHLNQGSSRKALLFYNKSLEVSPGYVPALNNIGVLYSRQGEDQKALVAFEKANKQSRFAKTPRYNLARLYLRYGLAELALPLFRGLLNESTNDIDLLNAVGNCYFLTSDYQQAVAHFTRIPSSHISHAEIGLNFAVALNKMGKTKEAQNVFSGIDKPKSQALNDYYSTVSSQLGVQ